MMREFFIGMNSLREHQRGQTHAGPGPAECREWGGTASSEGLA
jgi:hypothetical protein